MNTITITYQAENAAPQTFVIDGDKHDVGAILERCRKRIFPDVDPPEVDVVHDEIMARPKPILRPVEVVEDEKPAKFVAPSGVRETSKVALREHRATGKLTAQQRCVVAWIRAHADRDWTRQELSKAVGLGINVICGRVNELLKEPHCALKETRKRECKITGETAMALELA